jgi:hypothetical protein
MTILATMMPAASYPIPVDPRRCLFGEALWTSCLWDIKKMSVIPMFHLRCPVRVDLVYVTGRIYAIP